MRLKGKIAIVTGGGQGLGGAMARMFAREGASVAIAQRTEAKLAETKAAIEAAGGQVLAMPADVGKPADVEALVAATVERFGGLDILVNNAGIGSWKPVTESDEADYDRVLDTNLKGLWMGCHHAVPHMKARGGGAIVNISSVHGIQGGEVNSIYAATKGGIIGVTKALAQELAPFRIRVNTISPGAICVGDTRGRNLAKVKPEHHQEMLERFGDDLNPVHRYFQPLEMVGMPDDIAHGALYLVSEEARFVTGQNLVIDGGLTTYLSNTKLERERIRAKEQLQADIQAFVAEHGVDEASS